MGIILSIRETGSTISGMRFSTMRAIIAAIAGAVFLAAGCAHFPVNAPLLQVDPQAGYRFGNFPPTDKNTDDVFVVLALSAGGMRSIAYSYGLLEALQKATVQFAGPPRSLLDEVDVITSVSSSSILAAYYAAHHEQTFDTFPARGLYTDLHAKAWAGAMNPVTWPRVASAAFSYTDLFAELFDDEVYDHLTYADLIREHRRPYVLLNAADFSLGARFEFSQEQFDCLNSDLASVSLGRAVAASMATPVLVPPMIFVNHPRESNCGEPAWRPATESGPAASPRVQRRVEFLRSYKDAANRPYIRLVDGGYGGYLGLEGVAVAFLSPDMDFSIRRLINERKIKKLVIISANAIRTPDMQWDKTLRSPGWFDLLYFGLTMPIRNNSVEMVTALRDLLNADHADKDRPLYETYFITVDFTGVQDPALRQRLEQMPTSLTLQREQIDDLRRAATETLHNSKEYQRLLKDLK